MESQVFLAKEGKVSGPFDANQIEAMKRSGEFYRFEWMWDGQSPDWSPVPRNLASPPPLPEERTQTQVPGAETKVSPATNRSAPVAAKSPFAGADIKTSEKTFCAVLFDNRLTIGGEVTQAHARGGKFVSTPSQSTPIQKGATALLDLLDEANDRSTKIQTQVLQVSRMGDRWVLDLEWAQLPLL